MYFWYCCYIIWLFVTFYFLIQEGLGWTYNHKIEKVQECIVFLIFDFMSIILPYGILYTARGGVDLGMAHFRAKLYGVQGGGGVEIYTIE